MRVIGDFGGSLWRLELPRIIPFLDSIKSKNDSFCSFSCFLILILNRPTDSVKEGEKLRFYDFFWSFRG